MRMRAEMRLFMKLTSRQRAYLRSLASNENAIIQVGKSTLTPEVTDLIAEAFNTRELVKVTVLKNCDQDIKEIAGMVAERTHSTLVEVIGRRFVLYKPDRKNPRIILPTAGTKTDDEE